MCPYSKPGVKSFSLYNRVPSEFERCQLGSGSGASIQPYAFIILHLRPSSCSKLFPKILRSFTFKGIVKISRAFLISRHTGERRTQYHLHRIMDSLFAQIEALAVQADTAGRHKVLDLLRSLQLKLETPHDTLSRFSGLVRTPKTAQGRFLLVKRLTRGLAS